MFNACKCSNPVYRGSGLVVAQTTPWATQRQTDATNSAGDLTIPPRVCRNPFAFKALTSSGLRGPLASGTDAPQGETSGYGRLVKPHCPGSPSTEVYRNHTPRGWHRECAWGEWGMRSEHFRDLEGAAWVSRGCAKPISVATCKEQRCKR